MMQMDKIFQYDLKLKLKVCQLTSTYKKTAQILGGGPNFGDLAIDFGDLAIAK